MKIRNLIPLIGLVIFGYIIYYVGLEEIWSSLKSIKLTYIPLILFLVILDIILFSYKWNLLLKYQEISLGFFDAIKITLIGLFYGVITPMRLGYFIKIKLLRNKTNITLGEAIPSVFIDRLIDFVLLLLLVILSSLYLINIKFIGRFDEFIYVDIFIFIFILFFIWFFLNRKRSKIIFIRLYRFLIPKKFKELAKNSFNSFYSSLPNKKQLLIPIFLTFFSWILLFNIIYFIGLSLDIKLDYLNFIILCPIIILFSLMPISIAGLGTRDAASIFLFGLFGIGADTVVALSLLTFVFTDLLMGVTGFIFSLEKNDSINNNPISGLE